MPSLVPVSGNPFAPAEPSLVPVSHNPFTSESIGPNHVTQGDITALMGAPHPQKSQMLGFVQGANRPYENIARAASAAADVLHLPQGVRDAIAHSPVPLSPLGLPSPADINASLGAAHAYEAQAKAQGKVPGGAGEFGAQMLTSAPLMAFGGPGVQGALAGLANTDKSTPLGVAGDAGLGFLAGRTMSKATDILADVIAPKVTGAARWLMDQGVSLTPGMAKGGSANAIEQKLMSLPFVGDMIGEARQRTADSFRRGYANYALDPLGEKLPGGLEGMHDVAGAVQDATDRAYGRTLPNMTVRLDPQFQQDMLGLKPKIDVLPPAQQAHLQTLSENVFKPRFDANGMMSGDNLQAAYSDLGNLANRYRTSSLTGEREMASVLNDWRGVLRDTAGRQNPAYADELAAANTAYARAVPMEKAINAASGKEGDFSPAQLATALKQGSTRRQFSSGSALGQDWATNGTSVLGSSVPDSGTAGRGLLAGILLEGSHALHNPVALGALLGGTIPYTEMGQDAAQAWLNPGPGRQAVGSAVRALSRPLGLAAALSAPGVVNASPAPAQ